MTLHLVSKTVVRPSLRADQVSERGGAEGPDAARLRHTLYGPEGAGWPLPDEAALLAALVRLADDHRVKELLPLPSDPLEVALVRRAEQLFVSLYPMQQGEEPWLLDRQVPMGALLRVCVERLEAKARKAASEATRDVLVRLARRGQGRRPRAQRDDWPRPVRLRGAVVLPAEHPVRFRFEGRLQPLPARGSRRVLRADAHALLFSGRLWATLRGRRLDLGEGPLIPRLEAMLAVVEAAMDAEARGRGVHVRRTVSGTGVHLTRIRSGVVRFGLAAGGEAPVFVRLREVADVALAVCSLGRELVRQVLRHDRAQSHNLRLRALRFRLRSLKRAVDRRRRLAAIRNDDAERLRWHPEPSRASEGPPLARPLRYRERWRLQLDGVEPAGVLVDEEVLVVSTSAHQVAVDRGSGEVRWAREAPRWTALVGSWLLRQEASGVLECCEASDGEPRATVALGAEVRASWTSRLYGLPTLCVLADARGGLCAVDPRSGAVRWRRTRLDASGRATLHGRALLVAREGGALEALDVHDGETVWRGQLDGEPCGRPIVVGERVVVPLVRGEEGGLAAFDLWRGVPCWRRWMQGVRPWRMEASRGLLVGDWAGTEGTSLLAVEPEGGRLRWMVPASFLEQGEWRLLSDRLLCVSPEGSVRAFSLGSGRLVWEERLGEPEEAVPRRLRPVLRGGVIFVPLGGVSALEPEEGRLHGTFDVDVVPDWFHVDARGVAYVAEESGLLVCGWPAPSLALVSTERPMMERR